MSVAQKLNIFNSRCDYRFLAESKNLIKYNHNNLRKINEEKETINIEFIEQNADSENDENTIDFRWLDVQEKTGATTKVNLVEGLQKKDDKEIFRKKGH